MTKTRRPQLLLLFIVLTLIAWFGVAPNRFIESRVTRAEESAASFPETQSAVTQAFYTVRRDVRRCAAPFCGGYFVRRVNWPMTRCANGRMAAECYVSRIDWNGVAEVEAKRALLRGSLTRGDQTGRYGILKVDEVWQAASDNFPAFEFYRVRDLGVRCIAAPCLSHQEAKLNTTRIGKIAGVSIESTGASEAAVGRAYQEMSSPDGILVSGRHHTVTGPAGRAQTIKAAQFYLRVEKSSSEMKPCIKTGCSGEICADETVMSTCEYRREYDCYKRAICERQRSGSCGFTMTPELRRCLARR